MNLKEIFNQITISYHNVDLNKITPLRNYQNYLCDFLESNEKHMVTLALHTGSEYYNAIALSVVAIKCLLHKNTNIEELLNTININDTILYKGKRVQYKGIEQRDDRKYFVYFSHDNAIHSIPLEGVAWSSIAIYKGNAKSLGGQGIKTDFNERINFLKHFLSENAINVVPNCVGIVCQKDIAEALYDGIIIKYNNKTIKLAQLCTAAYYSENEQYKLGSNPSNEPPILRFYSKLFTCRSGIINDREKSFLGCIMLGESSWLNKSETPAIIDKKSLPFAIMAGKSHLTKYTTLIKSNESYKCYLPVKESIKSEYSISEYGPYSRSFENEIRSLSNFHIDVNIVESNVNQEIIDSIISKLLRIKNTRFNDVLKENFLIASYQLLNLCRTAVFPLKYVDEMSNEGNLHWSIGLRLNDIEKYINSSIGETKSNAEYVLCEIEKIIKTLYFECPKAEKLKYLLAQNKVDCIVITKAYYEAIIKKWIKDNCIDSVIRILPVTPYETSERFFGLTIFITPYYDFAFNPYAAYNTQKAIIMAYEYEQRRLRRVQLDIDNNKKEIQTRNFLNYEIELSYHKNEDNGESATIESFEDELDEFLKDLQVKKAYQYLFASSTNSKVQIYRLITFASGCVGYFTKFYKAYRLQGNQLEEVDIKELDVGDSIVFTRESDNKDIVDVILNRLLHGKLKNTQYVYLYDLSKKWKNALKVFKEQSGETAQSLSKLLASLDCEKDPATVSSWLRDESHIVGPRDTNDYIAIVKLTGIEDSPETIQNACQEIRRLRGKILGLMGKAIRCSISGLSAQEINAFGDVFDDISQLSQIEQISEIEQNIGEINISTNLINKPIPV